MSEFVLPEYGEKVLTSAASRIKMLAHRKGWIDTARPNQLPPQGTDWDIWLYLAGRGNGKTRLAGEHMAWDTWQHPNTITHVVAATHGDLRSVCYEGQSGLLSVIPPECLKHNGYNRSLGEIYLTNGSIFRGFSAESPDRARGPQCHRLWGDELAAWDLVKGGAQEMFDMAMLGLRLGPHSYAIFTTTPQPIQLIKNLVDLSAHKITDYNKQLAELRVRVTRGSTRENFANLSKNFRILISQYEGTRLGRQELEAEILEDFEGSLWNAAMFERPGFRSSPDGDYERIVVAIDPAASNNEGSDETGIVVVARTEDGMGYVLEDASGKYAPNEWGEKAIELYHKHMADVIIGEVNNGGDMVENTIRAIDPVINFKDVRASRGKATRAEPISALYEQGKIFHVGDRRGYRKLEDQMMAFTLDFNRKKAGFSPDRADALVWGFTELMLGEQDGQGIYEYYRQLSADLTYNRGVADAPSLVLMGTNADTYPTVFGRDGTKYEVKSNGTVNVKPDDVATFRHLGFKEMETSK